MKELQLRHGCNPNQVPAKVFSKSSELPFTVLSGSPGYINLCDALNSWQLAKELSTATGVCAAASFKHLSPAGVALGSPMNGALKKSCFVEDLDLSPIACAYARARGADRMSSFGDWVALSTTCDEMTARILKREVSDGIIAPGYTDEALEILKNKKRGQFNVIQIDPSYEAPGIEERDIFGITFAQNRNHYVPVGESLGEIVTMNKHIPDHVKNDLLLAQITLKYTQSNSICFSYDGQAIGIGAGQQSRIHCTRLAGSKADKWFLRQHAAVLDLPFKENIGRAEKNNAIDQFLEERLSPTEEKIWLENFSIKPKKLTSEEKRSYLTKQSGVSLGSDAFFPFRDNIDRAKAGGVSYVIQPGGSHRDNEIIAACNDYGMAMFFTHARLFHH